MKDDPYGLSPQRTRELMKAHCADNGDSTPPFAAHVESLPPKTKPNRSGPVGSKTKGREKRVRRGVRKILLTMGLGDSSRILIHKDYQALIHAFGKGKKHGRAFKTKINKHGVTHRDHLIVTRLT